MSPEAILEIRYRQQAVEQPGAISALDGQRIFLGARMEFTGDRLEDVLKGDDTLDFAVLVDYQHHLAVGGAEVFQQFHAGQRFRHENDWLEVVRQARGVAGQHLVEQVLGI